MLESAKFIYDIMKSLSKDVWINSKNEENDGELDQDYEEIIASHGIVLSKKPTTEQKAKDSTSRLRFESIMSEVSVKIDLNSVEF